MSNLKHVSFNEIFIIYIKNHLIGKVDSNAHY